MQTLLAAFLTGFLLAACLPGAVCGAAEVTVVETVSGRLLTIEEAAEDLAGRSDVVVFNEFHDQPLLHELEARVWQELYRQKPESVALSMEMFERDVQPVLDAYLADEITEPEFLSHSRPWPHYAADYRPLVEFAKDHRLGVVAANIPRPLAAAYAKTGMLPEDGKAYLPRRTYAPEGDYKKRFFAVMAGMEAQGMKVPPERYQAMYQAQCLKDDTMAESIADYLHAHPGRLLYHVQGEFHGAYRLGMVEKLQALLPEGKIAVLTPVYREPDRDDAAMLRQYAGSGDYLLILEKP